MKTLTEEFSDAMMDFSDKVYSHSLQKPTMGLWHPKGLMGIG